MLRGLFLLLMILSALACSSSQKRTELGPEEPPESSVRVDVPAARLIRHERLRAVVTDLAVAEKEGSIVLASRPDSDIPQSDSVARIQKFSRDGRRLWQIPTGGSVRNLAISDDGRWVVISGYDESIRVHDGRTGKLSLESSGQCRPYLISEISQLVCFHDDDADAQVAFHLVDLKAAQKKRGRSVVSAVPNVGPSAMRVLPAGRDVLSAVLGPTHFVMSLEGGELWVFPRKRIWQNPRVIKASGEVRTFSVGSHFVAVLVGPRRVELFSLDDGSHAQAELGFDVSALEPVKRGFIAAGDELQRSTVVRRLQQIIVGAKPSGLSWSWGWSVSNSLLGELGDEPIALSSSHQGSGVWARFGARVLGWDEAGVELSHVALTTEDPVRLQRLDTVRDELVLLIDDGQLFWVKER